MPKRSAPLALSLFLCLPAAAAGAGRAFTLEDLYRVKSVGEPAISPDGKTIAYSVATSDWKTKKKTSAIWRVGADGSGARPLTAGEALDSHPFFSPDGKTLAFVSTRTGEPQIFLLPLAGGEAEQKTRIPGGIDNPAFSRDGRHVVFSADVLPACGADAACNRKAFAAREASKIKAHLADSLLYRHWTEWKDGKRTHVLLLDLAETDADKAVRDLTPGDFDSPPFSVGDGRAFDLSPDGRELAFASNRDADPAFSTNADVFTVPVGGDAAAPAAPKNLTAVNKGFDGSPRYSPDGRFLAFTRQVTPRYEADRERIILRDRATGAERDVTASFDDTVRDFDFSRDGSRIFFTADVKGRTPLYEIVLATGALRAVSSVGTLDAWVLAPDASFAVAARRRIGSPLELWRLSLASGGDGEGVRLTTHNAAFEKEVDVRPAEEIAVPGAGGKPVQVWIVKPHGFDPAKKYPLILNVHGGPQQQWSDAYRGDWQVYPGAGYVVAFPNPHGSTGFGQAYTSAISRDWNGKVMTDVEKVADALEKLPYVDKERMGAMGWSWGGYAMMWLEGRTTRFKALASMMGVYDLRAMYSSTEEVWFPDWDLGGAPWKNPAVYRAQSPSEYVTAFKTPCLVITGEKDYRVPYTQSLEFFNDLQARGVPSRLIVFEKAGHWPGAFEMALYYAAHLDWFHRWLGGPPSPWKPDDLVEGR
ncbi:MAG TPA: S9 family peptidase [Thermoanaerobaculia bacterium]|nr:S9 family peptidase [Thermoanaerobaculia bacterium]